MIQRIQTLYFVAIIIICATLCTGSVISIRQELPTGGTGEYNLNLFYFSAIENGTEATVKLQVELIAIAATLIGLTTTILFSFKNREKQMKLVRVNYLVMLLLVLATFAKAMILIPSFSFGKLIPYSVVGLLLMLFLFYLNWRAYRLIKKDDDMVKSADRIR